MKKIRFWLAILGISLVIPIIGFSVSKNMESNYHKIYIESLSTSLPGIDTLDTNTIPPALDIDNFCTSDDLSGSVKSFCADYTNIKYLNYFSIIIIFFSIFILLIILVLGKFAVNNRKILLLIFKPGLFISQISAAILVAANSGILIYSIYIAEPYYIGKLHTGFILVAAITAAIAVLKVFANALTPTKIANANVFGKCLSKDEHKELWNFVESIANNANTTPPDTIIAGLEPTFFVTETKVTCLDGDINGKCLFLSLPFCRILSKLELKAIIGHELGHFVGEDTKWSQKFYPIYRSAIDTATELETHSNNSFALLPAAYFMCLFIDSFQKAEKSIGRDRELKADEIGAKLSTPEAMATALVKTHMYQDAWHNTTEQIKKSLSEGKQIINTSSYFKTICEMTPDDYMKDKLGNSKTFHPTDSHPPLHTRLEAINIQLSGIYSKCRKLPDTDLAIELISNYSSLEEKLSDLEHYKLIKTGIIEVSNLELENKDSEKIIKQN